MFFCVIQNYLHTVHKKTNKRQTRLSTRVYCKCKINMENSHSHGTSWGAGRGGGNHNVRAGGGGGGGGGQPPCTPDPPPPRVSTRVKLYREFNLISNAWLNPRWRPSFATSQSSSSNTTHKIYLTTSLAARSKEKRLYYCHD